jgi:Bacterial EndoU nuclease
MGIQQECDVLQSMLRQVIDSLTEAQTRAKSLPECDIYELRREISNILEICCEEMSRMKLTQNQIELIQEMIGNQSGAYTKSPYQISSIQPTPIIPSNLTDSPTIQPSSTGSPGNIQKPSMSNYSSGNIPSGVDVDNLSQINSQQRTHILDSDTTGGGHGPGRGISGKSEFPASWSDEQTMNYISEVIQDPNSIWFQQDGTAGAKYTKKGKPVKWQIDGTRDSVNIRVIVEPDGRGVITAFPTNIPPNP